MKTALVTGASRGVGRGIAIALVAAGYRVVATGRSIANADLPAAVVRHRCDHTNDDNVAQVFAQIAGAGAPLDLLVNNAWGGYERMVDASGRFTWLLPFWEQPDYVWSSMMDAGVRAAYFASVHAARLMIPNKRGLIVNVSLWAAQKHVANVVYGISKAATDKLTADTAHELKPHGVSVVSLYPGMVRTESVLKAAEGGWLDISNSESPEFIGRVIAGLADDPTTFERTGNVLVAAQEAIRLGITDVDGRQPTPLTLEVI
jgi:NAD(P)-dependent dehydrogenase (short-subunit alcohol dehydrogenase family)